MNRTRQAPRGRWKWLRRPQHGAVLVSFSLLLLGLPAQAGNLPPMLAGVHRIATMGASITQFGARPGGYVWLMQRYLDVLYPAAHIEVIDVGVSGNTSGDMVDRFRRDVIDRNADLVTIKAGFNDLTRKFSHGHPNGDGPGGASAGEYGRHVAAMVDMAAAAHIRVLLMTPTIYEDRPDSIRNEKLKGYVEAIRSLSRDRKIPLADQNAALMQAWLTRPPDERLPLTTDGVHMTLAGDAILARTALLALGIPASDLTAAAPRVQGMLARPAGAGFRAPSGMSEVVWQKQGASPRFAASVKSVNSARGGQPAASAELSRGVSPVFSHGNDAAKPGGSHSRESSAADASTAEVPLMALPTRPVPDYVLLSSRSPWPLLDPPSNNWTVESPQWLSPEHGDGVLTLRLHFPDRPAPHWSDYRAWTGRTLAAGSDMGDFDGFTFEARPERPSIDWTVDLLLVTEDGRTFVHRAAATLDRDGWVRGYALFRNFSILPWDKLTAGPSKPPTGAIPSAGKEADGNLPPPVWSSHLDPKRISGLYFGSIHPAGGGNTISIAGLELIKTASAPALAPSGSAPLSALEPGSSTAPPSARPAAPLASPSPASATTTPPAPATATPASPAAAPAAGAVVEVRVDPAVGLMINGQSEIPAGIFGLDLADLGKGLDGATLDAARDLRPGFIRIVHGNVSPAAADTEAQPSPAPGTASPGAAAPVYAAGSPEEQAVTGTGAADWMITASAAGRRPDNNDAWANGAAADLSRYVLKAPKTLPPPRLEVWNDPEDRDTMTGGAVEADIQAMLDDPYRMGSVLGPVARDVYSSIFDAVYRTIKTSLPSLQVGGFSLPLPAGEDWRMWDVWWRPLLQRQRTTLDFLTEHHSWPSGGSYQANLMLIAAWSVENTGRILPVYCTADGALPGTGGNDAQTGVPFLAWGMADYEIQDILTMLREPDKVAARAAGGFPAAFAAQGAVSEDARRTPDYWAHYTLRDLRGARLAATATPPEEVEVVSSSEGNNVVVAAYNHSNEPRQIHVVAASARGTHYSAALERHFGVDPGTGTLLLERGKKLTVTGEGFSTSDTIAGHELVCYTLTSSQSPRIGRTLELGDAFADRWYLTIYPNRLETMRVFLTDLRDVTSASLRVAAQGVDFGNGKVALNGHDIILPFISANAPDVVTLPLNPEWIKPGENDLTFSNNGIPGAGKFRFLAASIRTVRETTTPRE